MVFRTAVLTDISQMQIVRNAVKENMLSDPNLVTDADCAEFMTQRGKGWVCEAEDCVLGFAIADLKEHNIWALFVLPEQEGKGIGKTLHDLMLNWYFENTQETVWLSTDEGTRAEQFYTKNGWTAVGRYGKTEVKFEMKYSDWKHVKSIQSHQNYLNTLNQFYTKGELYRISLGKTERKTNNKAVNSLTAKIIKFYTKGHDAAEIADLLEIEIETVNAVIADYEAE
jgi:GNAT superfamily N-acetyltransferase